MKWIQMFLDCNNNNNNNKKDLPLEQGESVYTHHQNASF